ncbi:MAG: hypothetical protein ABI947_22490 [Chloroflexota bacterium]
MPDTLDLPELMQRGDSILRQARRRNRRTIAILVIIVGFVVVQRLTIGKQLGALYTFNGTSINSPKSPIDPAPYRVHTSSDSSVWVESSDCSYLYRYLDGTWTQYDYSDFRTSRGCVQTLAVDGSDAWGISGRDVTHFDGTRWTIYTNAVGKDSHNIAIGKWGVVVIDFYGGLRLFDGKRWTNQQAKNVLPDFIDGSVDYDPSMQTAPDGSLILAYFGLWRFDGHEWTQITPIAEDQATGMRLLAVDGDTAWLSTSDGMASFNLLSGQWQQFDARTIGLPSGERIESAAAQNGMVYASSVSGLYHFDGKSWNVINGLNVTENEIGNVAIDTKGTVWVPLYSTQIYDRSFMTTYLISTLLTTVGAAFLILITLLFSWWLPILRSSVKTTQESRVILTDILPQLPKYAASATASQVTGKEFWGMVIVGVALGLLLGAANASVAEIILAIFVATIVLNIIRRVLRFRQTANPQAREDLMHTTRAMGVYTALLLGSVFLANFITSPIVGQLIHDVALSVFLNVEISLIVGFGIYYCILLLPTLPVLLIYHGPLRRADYDTALNRANRYLKYLPHHPSFLFLRAETIQLAGNVEDAAKTWEGVLTEIQNSGATLVSLALVNLGSSLDSLGQPDEALRLIEAGIKLRPNSAISYLLLINHYNLFKVNPERALEISDVMMHFAKRPRTNLFLGLTNWGQILAERALVLALAHRYEEADLVIAQAFSDSDKGFVPGLVMLHVKAGQIVLLKGNRAAAQDHFKTALQLDPKGGTTKRVAEWLNRPDLDPMEADSTPPDISTTE